MDFKCNLYVSHKVQTAIRSSQEQDIIRLQHRKSITDQYDFIMNIL